MNLYERSTLDAEKICALRSDKEQDDTRDELAMIPDEHITLEELPSCFRAAKKERLFRRTASRTNSSKHPLKRF